MNWMFMEKSNHVNHQIHHMSKRNPEEWQDKIVSLHKNMLKEAEKKLDADGFSTFVGYIRHLIQKDLKKPAPKRKRVLRV